MSGRSRHATETFGLLNFPVSFFSLAWHGFLYWLCHDFTCMYRMPIKCHKTVLIPHHGEGFPCARLSICKYACIVAIKCRFDDWLNFWKDFIWKFSIIKFSITTIMTLCKLAHEELQLALFFFSFWPGVATSLNGQTYNQKVLMYSSTLWWAWVENHVETVTFTLIISKS